MKFRVARHTHKLSPIIKFYTEILGLEILGSFEKHDDYDGVFLGHTKSNWHLEFTVSNEKPDHRSDEDDLLVFYSSSQKEYEDILQRFKEHGHEAKLAKNPYWNSNGSYFLDPDGFGIIITK